MSWNTLSDKQPYIVKLLTNSIRKERLAHAYLFKGNKGTGKKQVAIQLTKAYFCRAREASEPCDDCSDCKRIDSGNHPDVHVVAPDGQSIKIEQIRKLQKEFSYLGLESKSKAYIIEHADKMTTQAANSLLKFLEEPGQKTIAFLLTENPHQMLDTIRSRCQILTFAPQSQSELSYTLQETGYSKQLAQTAVALTNDQKEAEELLNDEWFVQARKNVLKLGEELHERPHRVLLALNEYWHPHFKEKQQVGIGLDLLLLWFKDVFLTQLEEEQSIVFNDCQNILSVQALHSSQSRVQQQMMQVLEAKRRLNANMNLQLLMEQLVLRLQEG
ncbi:DNA polymerase III subunit delta' [Pseudalkalibacillus berkeleyi]|uniref:DNA polymerase III subunit delta' n=1 Tax=Pseudalkalibacillus berkeleyi TaxID=1069813 RepID=A0ABS9H7A1_9BACL|nr:DNA polymerase III subunit delta' [Pseudalkalibacillus berkeleyi]MCF6139570.1 DNA polymerase III subunit delta' [Pseudalkalibacillus berkeleyi]